MRKRPTRELARAYRDHELRESGWTKWNLEYKHSSGMRCSLIWWGIHLEDFKLIGESHGRRLRRKLDIAQKRLNSLKTEQRGRKA